MMHCWSDISDQKPHFYILSLFKKINKFQIYLYLIMLLPGWGDVQMGVKMRLANSLFTVT